MIFWKELLTKRPLAFVVVLFIALAGQAQGQTTANANQPRQFANGVVFHDRNNDGARDEGEQGLEGVRVSNGREVVKTDAQGRYRLPISNDTIIFVVKPRGWMTRIGKNNLPRFYYIHKPAGSPANFQYKGVAPTGALPASVDFPLSRREEPDQFRIILFGDTQPRDQQEIDYIAHDVIESLIGEQAAFGITLGDIMFDDLSLFESLNRTIARIDIPWYNTIGNHDINFDAPNNELADETFESVYGPSYYSFDYGPVHFIVMNDVEWSGSTPEGRGTYKGNLGARQLEFIRNNLTFVPKEHLIVLTMHIPLVEVDDRQELFHLLAARPHTLSLSAHTHIQQHIFFTGKDGWTGQAPHHHVNHATVCGSWWTGAPDENGIPHTTMRDGAPNGYSFVNFDGNKYTVEFRAARRPASHQMNIFAPEVIAAEESARTEVLVNVFAGSERSKVEMRIRGSKTWIPLERTEQEDPYYVRLKMQETSSVPSPGRKLPKAAQSTHLWIGRLPRDVSKGTQLIEVRTTDMFGKTYTDQRIIRVR
ncbi:MAG: calcineurin-like phosphoesterase family protein [Acidobacteriota bacterium]|nr:calcineurin-like phosphoesterase family protein [Acidobacteriota bacterium]